MDSCNSTASMESSSCADEDDYTAHPSVVPSVAPPSPGFLPFIMSGGSGGGSSHLLFLHGHDHNPPLHPFPMFEPLPSSFDQVVRPGPTDRNNHNHLHQNQLFQLGVGGDELSAMLPPPALHVPSNLGNCSCQSQVSNGLMGGVPSLVAPLVSDPPKPKEERPGRGNSNGVMPPRRKPKKRTRVSRRAPTTVLTTDTNNFRAMVQEFTGIPAPPFAAASSPFQQARLDLFGTNFASSAAPTGTSLPRPSYLLRPFVPVSTSGVNMGIATSTELFFPLLSDSNNHISGNPNATSSSTSIIDLGQVLAKYHSDHDQEPADEETDNNPQVNLRKGAAKDHDSSAVSPSPSRNVEVGIRSEGMPRMESWICSSDGSLV
ncbi:hypothetical protein MLD38_003291 [Melastoma candidum]|uniref:Uncharacterized protein n=1 Tax=Melastoma candidum TaxID=119954 RepID=A0ACB9S249_9MYRT|nr:hypothetical protein MLD38_003291 [Melastoma candidum]